MEKSRHYIVEIYTNIKNLYICIFIEMKKLRVLL